MSGKKEDGKRAAPAGRGAGLLFAAAVLAMYPAQQMLAQGEPVACTSARRTPPVVDSTALLRDLDALAHDSMQGRGFGTPGGARARAYLVRRMAQIGLDSFPRGRLQTVTLQKENQQLEGANVIGVVQGTDPSAPAFVITAHYDHLGTKNGQIYNGADDNASGSSALLAAADHFRRSRPRHTIVFVLLDAEEASGLKGSRTFVAEPPIARERIALNINLDMVSRSPKGELYVVGPAHRPELRALVASAACAAPIKLMLGHDKGASPSDDWTTQSDHYAFHERQIPFLYFGVEDHPDYHRPTDDPDKVDRAFFMGAAQTVIAAIEAADRN